MCCGKRCLGTSSVAKKVYNLLNLKVLNYLKYLKLFEVLFKKNNKKLKEFVDRNISLNKSIIL